MFDRHFILHLTLIENIGPATIYPILELQRSGACASDLYLFSTADWKQTFGFTDLTAEKLVDGLACTRILDEELDLIAANNVQWAISEDETYPPLLREIYLPPAVLYWQGEPLHDIKKTLSIVGARKADSYGYRVVNALVPDLVAAQYTIISGGAEGIDTMAHEATLKAGGKTIAVFGSGLFRPYPTSNCDLFKSIVQNGGSIVSIFPLRMRSLPGNFPARNRIITGLSQGCLVVQAAKKSGALISAHYAMEQGREVFAVPGPVDDMFSIGCNTLIQSGAKLVMTSNDILEEFGDRLMLCDKKIMEHRAQQLSLESVMGLPKKSVKSVVDKYVLSAEALAKEEHYSDVQKKIITACMQSSYFDTIVTQTHLTSEVVQSELFNLQLDGVISQDFTGMWIASKI